MLGAWIFGGVEWDFPHRHRATTAMPIDWRAVENADGSKTIWIGETELRRRLKWTIGLSLLPDRAVLKAENVFMNRQPWIESMIYWANVSVHCGDDYQILFPPSMHFGFDHHKNYWTSFPIGPRKEEVELLPPQCSKYTDDISGTMDLSWWCNFTIESRSIFGMDPDNAWLAGFDHKGAGGSVGSLLVRRMVVSWLAHGCWMVGCAYVGVGEWLKTATCQKLAKGIDLWYIKWYYTHALITWKECYASIDSY